MRIWSVHPKYLDAAGLVALWREALLARKVLEGKTRGYKNHPQLVRFKKTADPVAAVDVYLKAVMKEAILRGYRFDPSKLSGLKFDGKVSVTSGQIDYEWKHLIAKLEKRSPETFQKTAGIKRPEAHTLFEIIPGGIEPWEVAL